MAWRSGETAGVAMSDLFHAVEIWLLTTAMLSWFFSRAALRLRHTPPPAAERPPTPQALHEDSAIHEPRPLVVRPVARAMRADEKA
jgi:hypothetical protein